MKKLLALTLLLPFMCNADNRSIARTARKTDHAIDTIFVERWSPRAMSGETISDDELMKVFEAARWAPSSYNTQPWRFIYAKRDSKQWSTFLNLLVDFNKEWAQNASALVLVVSRNVSEHNGKPLRTHSLDTGAAWQNLALQGARSGLAIHAMCGFDVERAKKELRITDEYSVEIMIAVGKPGKLEVLPERVRAWEKPSDRKPLKELVFNGVFK